ncbi:amino acid adenylation domain-containing protein [Pseudomonas mangiferae]|uniref:amino acid adenylation domain-containing protein n=1 Tax=Pseudomonas mangiferae TaxID=2593654 RepID=UPI001E456E8E|nr:amino acid adenylation domain-containing protein [Pseudomonas mangiferae]
MSDKDSAYQDKPFRLEEKGTVASASERELIASWNATDHPYPLDITLARLIETQVQRSPDAIAIRFENRALSFDALNRKANRLAHYLRELGIGPDCLVGVQMERSPELVVALLGILKAGGTYLPLDPAYPAERLALILDDASVTVVLTQERFRQRLSDFDGEVLCLDSSDGQDLSAHENDPVPLAGPDHLAYVIYTSGSTGRPKGCMVPHRAICNRLLWMQRHYAIGGEDRILQKTPFTFDVSVWELFLPLLSGACLVMARPEGHKDTQYLVQTIQAERVTVCHFVPSMLRFFLKHPEVSACGTLRKVFVSGEALTHDLLLHFRQRLTAELHNLYGPTEAAVDVTCWRAEPRPDGVVPIGRPIDNLQIHILDEQARPVPLGQTGELCIGGVGLARGYLNRPELTAEKFIRDPFSPEAGARLYRTGDEARFLADGEIEVLGRFDSQVKLRGFRIELGEIESTLKAHPAIEDAVVLVKDAGTEDPKLVAFVVAEGLDRKTVRAFVQERLPEYMTPNLVTFIDQVPVTAHGKADRKALLAGEPIQPPPASPSALDAPSLTAWLQAYFSEALGGEALAADDDLFDRGATSFTLVQAVHSIQQRYQVTLPIDVFLQQPTVGAIAARILDAGSAHPSAEAGAAPAQVSPGCQPATASTIALDEVRFEPTAYRRPGTGLPATLDRLGCLLSLLREVTLDGQGKYLYSSAGGLNAVQCYLYVAEGRVEGLPGGAYYYQPRLNRLLPVHVPVGPGAEVLASKGTMPPGGAGFLLALVAETAAIVPLYNQAAPSLLVLEAGYIEQLLLSRQADFQIRMAPAQAVDTAALVALFALQTSHQVVRCLVEGGDPAGTAARSPRFDVALADFLGGRNEGFELPSREELVQLHEAQRQIRRDLPEQGDGVVALPAAPIPDAALKLRAAKRQYRDGPVRLDQVSRLLNLLRAGPEGEHLYLDDTRARLTAYLYIVEQGVRDEPNGRDVPGALYRYDAVQHCLLEVGPADPTAIGHSYTPFNRKHANLARLQVFLVAEAAAVREAAGRHACLLQAGRIGQLLLEKQAEFGLGLCPIGSLYFDRIRTAFGLDEGDELIHSFVGGAVAQALPAGWPRLEPGRSREPDASHAPGEQALAIVGLSGRYPGAATPDALWQNLHAGRSAIETVSAEDLLRGHGLGDDSRQWRVGALSGAQLFDPLLFRITPAEARTLDPQERLFLQAVWHCLENAGYTAASLRHQAGRVGVFVGAMWGDHQHHQPAADGGRTTSFHSAIANRVSFFNDFNGPSVAIDTSCSSTMTALHFACSSIRQGECGAAIVGGVNLISHPAHLELLSSLALLSEEGEAHPFGLQAKGWVAGEGVGALLLRPLEDARRDGDTVLGIVRATSIGHGGQTFRYGAPSADSQADSMRRVLAQAGLSADDIGHVEAAAPGASLADAAEFSALAQVFGEGRQGPPLSVGSIKANIGHLESASALSQITKVLFQLKHGQLAPTLGCQPLSPMIDAAGALAIVDRPSPWQGAPRALINAFGASGSGGHAILEAPPEADATVEQAGPWLFPFSAASDEQLRRLVADFAEALRTGGFEDATLADMAYTLCVGRVVMGHRLAVVAAGRDELLAHLSARDDASLDVVRGRLGPDAPAESGEERLHGLDRPALRVIANRWVSGQADLSTVARQGQRRVALTPYPFAQVDCHPANQAAPEQPLPLPTFRDEELQQALEGYLRRQFAQVSAIPETSLDSEETFDRYGLTSLMITALNQRLAADFGALPSTLFFEYQSLAALAGYLAGTHGSRGRVLLDLPARAPAAPAPATDRRAQAPVPSGRQAHDEPIAIIGLSGRFPGAPDLETFWANLSQGVDSIREIPLERWPHRPYYSRERGEKGKITSKWGGFIDHADCFDPLFFNISPRDAERMDPQERIFLETAWQTLEDAGYDRSGLQRHYQGEMGVFVGVMHGEYLLYTRSTAADCTDDAVDASFGSIANRVSYVLDCKGPSMAVDTICSSSLTALHLAVESLRRGECQLALAGGVNLSLHPNKYFIQSQLTMSSSDGRCRSFGEGGDGFVPGEGVGAVLLKPLSRAEADGDQIHGVIRATSVNHNGKTHGYTVPSPNAQGAMIAASLDKANMDPRELSYVEAHGTGTALGDPIEIAGLQSGFARRSATLGHPGAGPQTCAVGSVKSNIGHLESAAGIAGIAKVLLQLRHGQWAPSLHSHRLNPGIAFAETPFHVPQRLQAWPRPMLDLEGTLREYPRVASVSSFGSGGSNGHVIIAEYRGPERVPERLGQTLIIPLSARTRPQLRQRVEQVQRFLLRTAEEGSPPRLDDLAFTLQRGREAMDHRLAFTISSWEELLAKLALALEALATDDPQPGAHEGLFVGRTKDNRTALTGLFNDEDMAATLAAWAEKGKYAKLMDVWVRGLTLDWAALGVPGESARRISLPGYPFARERVWVSGASRSVGARDEAAWLHPLVQRNVSDLSRQKFTSVFTGDEFFLRDHRVGTRKLLPGVAYLEMAREALVLALGEQARDGVPSLRNVVWAQPVGLEEQGDEAVAVDVQVDRLDGQRLAFEIVERAHQVLCCQGEAVLLGQADAATTPLSALQATIGTRTLEAEVLYELFEGMGIHYGPWHRTVRELRVSEGQVLAHIELPDERHAEPHRFVLHPSLMDGALQATVGVLAAASLAQDETPRVRETWVPFALESLHLGGGTLGALAWAWVRRGAGDEDAAQPRFDLDLFDAQGQVCVALRGFALRAMKRPASFRALLDDRPDRHGFLVERWNRVVLPRPAPSPAPSLLLISSDAHGEAALKARYPGAATLRLEGHESIECLIDRLRATGPFDHLVWLAPAASAADALDGMIQAQQAGTLGLFRLLKALQADGWDRRPLAWTVVTRATVAVFGEVERLHQAQSEPMAPSHASLQGLVGAMAKEYPHWPVRLLDLPAGEEWPAHDLVSLPADPQGNALAYREGVWYRPCLTPWQPLPAPGILEGQGTTSYRQGGIYLVVGGAGGIGRVFSEHLIRACGAQVIWLGRRERDAGIDAAIEQLGRLGPSPRYLRADATVHADLRQAVEQVLAEYGAIHGVVHAALQLQDQSLARMDEARFAAGLAAKVDTCVRLGELFQHRPLDFMLFFSSLQCFTKSAGQSNYAAGCTFKNAFGRYLAQRLAYPVKVINWGYWGDVGSVAGDDYRRRMAAVGLGSIQSEPAMAALETLLARPLAQVTFLRGAGRLRETFEKLALPTHPDGPFGEYGESLAEAAPSVLPQLKSRPATDSHAVREAVRRMESHRTAFEDLQGRLLHAQLQGLGGFGERYETLAELMQRLGVAPRYERWLDASLDELVQRGHLQRQRDDSGACRLVNVRTPAVEPLWREWDAHRPAWLEQPGLKAEALLAEATLRVLPDILLGRLAATDILFPESSMARVEGIYQRNPVSDFFNDALLDVLQAFVEERLTREPDASIRILEIGAGTGGTSARAFDRLRPYQARIAEYCYTDLSQAFLSHARQAYGADNPYLRYQLFDVNRPLAEQGIASGAYDLVIATNVLHATADLRLTLRNAKAALMRNGLVLINEIGRNGLFTHLTFGLLTGWWLFEDRELRLPGGPALAPKHWKRALEREGFRQVWFPALSEHDLGQQIVVAESDGMIWQRAPAEEAPVRLAPRVLAAAPARTLPPAVAIAAAPAQPTVAPPQAMKARTVDYLREVIGGLFKIRPDEIDAHEPLETYGIDSILVVQLTNLLRGKLADISSTLFFEHQTVEALATHLAATQPERLQALLGLGSPAETAAPITALAAEAPVDLGTHRFTSMAPAHTPDSPSVRDTDVAIIGLAGRYAQADTVRELWQRLERGESCIGEVPAERWDWRAYFDQTPGRAGRIYTRWGGFLRDIDAFDPLFFHIAPREAEKMDPQERVFLEQAYHCIGDAGYTPARLAEGSRVGVFVGVMNGTYARQSSYWSVANRVSYQFNFQGPSLAVDTACSSSLTAIHLALESLHSGVSECALVGGVNLVVDPVHYMGLSEMKMLSPGPACKAFGREADGFVDGEGVGALLLKPLARAEADGDRIYGVIRGSMINAGGKTNGYTVPNPVAQGRLVADSLARAGVDPRAVGYVEAHGTGTALGDPLEIAGLARAFDAGSEPPPRQSCAIGSIKSNIGHCESAAGIAGVTKVLLQLKHRRLVPSLHAGEPNPEIDFARTPFVVQQVLADWPAPSGNGEGGRIATVSSFGAGGANAHVVIEEYRDRRDRPAIVVDAQRPVIVPLSAKSDQQVRQQVRRLLDAVDADGLGDADLPALACTLQLGREAMSHRLGVLAASMDELKARLRATLDQPVREIRQPRAALDEQVVADWISRGEYPRLLDAWLDGAVLPWQLLYPQGAPVPLDLPAYPFARERYWHPDRPTTPSATVEARLHPLLHRNVSDLRGLRYLSRFSGREPFFTDHRVEGRGVLPGAAVIGLIQAALVQAGGEHAPGAFGPDAKALVIHELTWRLPFSVDDDNQGELFLELAPSTDDDFRVGLYSYGTGGHLCLHAEARAGFTDVPPLASPPFEIQGAESVDVEACYARFAAMGIAYGDGHRGVRALWRRDTAVLARIDLSDAQAGEQSVLPPGPIDAAMQAAMALLMDDLGEQPALWLPERLANSVWYGPCPSALRVRIERRAQDRDRARFDLILFDEAGRCCARLDGLAFKASVRPGAAANGLLCHKRWQAAAAPLALASPVPRLVLLLGGHPAFAGVAQRLHDRGEASHSLVDEGFPAAALALAERLAPWVRAGQPCLIQLVIPLDDPQGYAGLAGLLRSVSRERPALVAQLVEIATDLGEAPLDACLAAEAAVPRERCVRVLGEAEGNLRQVMVWEHQPLADAPTPWRTDGVYLITGGLGGVGLLLARAILEGAADARVVLCGRREAAAPDVAATCAALGGRVDYHAVDLADAAQVDALIASIQADHGGLHGILHCAGITRDGLLLDKTAVDFEAVFAAKVAGARHLDRACASQPLDFFVLCSSIASELGNVGQADYAAANGYLDAFAHQRNRLVATGSRQGRTVAINWPLWLEGGMRMSESARRVLAERTGLEAMTTAVGLGALYQALEQDDDQLMVLVGQTDRLVALLAGETGDAVSAPSLAPDEALPVLLRRLLAGAVKIAESRLDADVPFEQYGVDSLMIMDMTAALEKRFGTLPKTLFYEYPTLQALAEHLASRTERPVEEAGADPALLAWLRETLAEALEVPPASLDDDQCFERYGLDSLKALELTRRLERRTGALPPTLLFEQSSLRRLAEHLAREAVARPTVEAAPAPASKTPVVSAAPVRQQRLFETKAQVEQPVHERADVAIVGLAGRYPGAEDLDAFWQNLREGRDCIGDVPAERWDWRDYYSEDRTRHGVHNSKRGGFLDGIDGFDPLFFNISPLEAELIDPQERLFLQTAWAALEDAGYCRRPGHAADDESRQVGVYVGVMYAEYQLLGAEASLRGQRMGFAGSNASIANRVSFCLNLQGPSLSVDSMCSSSLTALHLACQDLRSGRTVMAIAGGVNLTLHPNKYLMLSSGQFISNQGHCASFGEGGDGYIPGEGVGAVILKRLADAERDGDHIYGVIKGSHLNHGGKSTGYSVPNPRAQQAAIGNALREAGVAPARVSYIEAHGTGTRLGDPIEIAGLASAFGSARTGEPCWIGSVKSNIGHCEAAAGIAGLTKVLLQFRHGEIAPSLHAETLNPYIDFASTPFEVNRRLRPWPQPLQDGRAVPRIAGISSFGAGGSNGHLVVEDYRVTHQPADDAEPQLILLSARDPDRLPLMARRLLARLARPEAGDSLAAVAYTLQVGREAMEHRAACIVQDEDELKEALRALAEGDESVWVRGEAGIASERVERFKADAGDAWHARLANLLADGRQRQILELWSEGLAIDWTALQASRGRPAQRISLPTYPFATQRYWAPTGSRLVPSLPRPVHPLLQQNVSGFDRQRFISEFTGEEPWLRDHQVGGRRMLPGAAYLEMIRAAACAATGVHGAPLVMERLNWLAPLAVEAGSHRLAVELQRQDAGIAVQVQGDDPYAVLHCQARVSLGLEKEPEPVDLAHWRGRHWAMCLDDAALYSRFERLGLVYGKTHRGIRRLWVAERHGQREVLAELVLDHLPTGEPDTALWLEPGIVDSALQAAIGVVLPLDEGVTSLPPLLMPFALERLELTAPCSGRMWALVRGRTADRLAIDLCDEEGRVCARFSGLASRALASRATAKAERPSDRSPVPGESLQLLAPLWSVVDGAGAGQPIRQGVRLVFGATPERREALARLWPDARFARTPVASEADCLAELDACEALAEVVWLAPTDDDAPLEANPSVASQRFGALGAFHLIKALLHLHHGRHPVRLLLVTGQAVAVRPGDTCRPTHASVHGLAGSLAKEYPHWQVCLADLADEQLAALHQAPFDAVASGELLAWRGGQWWRRQLAEVAAQAPDAAAPTYRDGGVYLVIGGAGGIGAAWSRHVVARHRARIVWVGRRPLEQDLEARLDAFTAFSLSQGAPAPVYLQADATDAAQLGAVRQQVLDRFGRISGLVHSAIVLEDQGLAAMQASTFSRVLDAKVATSVALATTFRDDAASLDFVLFFSSMMAFSTAAGQSNYAAGCTFADAFADRLRADWPCPVKVINWGYWGSVGSVSDDRYRQRMRALGLGSIEPEEAMQALDRLLQGRLDQLALLKVVVPDEAGAPDSLAILLGDDHLTLYPDSHGGLAAMRERLDRRLAALV